MNKGELIDKIADNTALKKKEVENVLTSFVDIVQNALKSGDKVAIAGFGTFDVSNTSKSAGL